MLKKKSISNFINDEYREFATYVLTSRGIPNVVDSLTPVQRLYLINTPKEFTKTISLVGKIIGQYRHGDSSLAGAISRGCKGFQSSEPFLLGYGFFGNLLTHKEASPRYTQVKINPLVRELIDEYSHLNKNNEFLQLGIPIGLLGVTMGIGVGFATKILPRKLSDIKKYLNGEKTQLIPHFKDWKGTVKKIGDSLNGWCLVPLVEFGDKEIIIKSIPPLSNYLKVIQRVRNLVNDENTKNKTSITIQNLSTEDIHVIISMGKSDGGVFSEEFKENIQKRVSLNVWENITFIHNNKVIEYEKVSDYLDDFKLQVEHLRKSDIIYNIKYQKREIKKSTMICDFIGFVLEKQRTSNEIVKWIGDSLKQYEGEDHDYLFQVIDSFKLRSATKEELEKQKANIEKSKSELESLEKQNDEFKFTIGNEIFGGFHSTIKTQSLLEIPESEFSVDGIENFGLDDILEMDNDTL